MNAVRRATHDSAEPGNAAGGHVYVVDDDVSVRESLEALLTQVGLSPLVFESAQSFLLHPRPRTAACLILDVRLPDLDGLDVQQRLASIDALPIIFLTGVGDVRMSVRAMKAGASEFLTKPFDTENLLESVYAALTRSRAELASGADLLTLRQCFESLSRREREVMSLVVRGRLNKQVGQALSISEITVKAHRGRVMRKMRARSLAELVTIANRLQLPTARDE